MGLKIKSKNDILVAMVNRTVKYSKRLLDFTPGSVLRMVYEAVATALEEFYFKSYKNMMWARENALYDAFNFQRRPAVSAFGNVRIRFTDQLPQDLTLPAGTTFTTSLRDSNTLYFETIVPYTIRKDSIEAVVEVHCNVPGEIGNVPANAIAMMTRSVGMISEVFNEERFRTGREEESLESRRARFYRYVETRSRGTREALEYGTLEVPGVTGVYVDDQSQISIVDVYAHDASGNLSSDLGERIRTHLEEYRAAGIPLFVKPIIKRTMNVTIELTVSYRNNNEDFQEYVRRQVLEYLDSFSVSQDLYLSNLNSHIRSLDRVGILNCRISNPASDVEVSPFELIRSGTVSVSFRESGEG